MLKEALSIREIIKDLYKKRNENYQSLAKEEEDCVKEMTIFKQEIEAILAKLVEESLKELNEIKRAEEGNIKTQISSLSNTSDMVNSDFELLRVAKDNGNKETMFALDVRITKNLKDYESFVTDIKTDTKPVRLSFERNVKLESILKDIKSMGAVKYIDSGVAESDSHHPELKLNIMNMQITSPKWVDITAPDETNPGYFKPAHFFQMVTLLLAIITGR